MGPFEYGLYVRTACKHGTDARLSKTCYSMARGMLTFGTLILCCGEIQVALGGGSNETVNTSQPARQLSRIGRSFSSSQSNSFSLPLYSRDGLPCGTLPILQTHEVTNGVGIKTLCLRVSCSVAIPGLWQSDGRGPDQ